MLRCENVATNKTDITNEFNDSEDGQLHMRTAADFDHGQWFVTCLDCGAQWSVNDAEGRDGEYFQFDMITNGDDYCLSQFLPLSR